MEANLTENHGHALGGTDIQSRPGDGLRQIVRDGRADCHWWDRSVSGSDGGMPDETP